MSLCHTDSVTDSGATAPQATKVSIKQPEALKVIYQIGHLPQAWQTGPLERAATAATITTTGWKGQRLLARQTSNQKHSETPLAQRAKDGKALESGRVIRKTEYKKDRNSTSLDCQKSRTFAAIEDYTCN